MGGLGIQEVSVRKERGSTAGFLHAAVSNTRGEGAGDRVGEVVGVSTGGTVRVGVVEAAPARGTAARTRGAGLPSAGVVVAAAATVGSSPEYLMLVYSRPSMMLFCSACIRCCNVSM